MKYFAAYIFLFAVYCSGYTQTIIFSNEFESFEISYPETWRLSDYVTEEVAFAAYNPRSTTSHYLETAEVKIMRSSTNELRTCAAATADMFKEKLNRFKLIKTEDVTIGGNRAYVLAYTHIIPKGKYIKRNIKLKSNTYLIVKENKVYMITYSADKKAFDHSIGDFKRMVNSFRFIFKLNA